ncbi:NADH dehydrogenase [hydrothermal vent metagenome]|uniref:NADH dehydrogenase n=1 Tax=hydrothermal vent metagenome TaxID=652676 RepID=A0A3B1E5Q7_9ZZZZ
MKHIVIIGGGYAGIYALRELVKNKNIKITLIDKHTFHNLQPEFYDLIANKSNIADVTIDLTTLCYGLEHNYLEFKNLRVVDIDLDKSKISTEENEIIEYDYLIISAGSRTFFPKSIKGLKNTDDIKKIHRAIFFKQSFENQLFNKISDEAKKCDKTHIAVVGAGLSGVEITAEMAYYAQKLFKRGGFACDNLEISLISGTNSILPGFKQNMINISHARLKSLGINIITNTKMTSCDKEYLYLSSGAKLRYSFIVFTGGIESANMTSELNLEKNQKGQIIVGQYLQVQNYKNIFACGDIAQIKNSHGDIMPQNVTIARCSGTNVGKNILNSIDDKTLEKCNPKLDGTLIALGGKYAVCDLYGVVRIKGFLGYLIKQYVFLRYKLPLLKYIKNGYKKLHKRGD